MKEAIDSGNYYIETLENMHKNDALAKERAEARLDAIFKELELEEKKDKQEIPIDIKQREQQVLRESIKKKEQEKENILTKEKSNQQELQRKRLQEIQIEKERRTTDQKHQKILRKDLEETKKRESDLRKEDIRKRSRAH